MVTVVLPELIFFFVVVVVHSKFLLLLLQPKPLAQSIQLSPYVGKRNVVVRSQISFASSRFVNDFVDAFGSPQWKSTLLSYHFYGQ